jgi:type I restriction enzyme S subunit
MVYEQKHAIKGSLNVETHYIDQQKFNELERFNVRGGDFIMSCRGTIGKIYQLPQDAPLGIIHPSLMKIRLKKDSFTPCFFLSLLSKIVANESTNGNCVQMAITAKDLGNKLIIYPPLSLQQSFAAKVSAIEAQKQAITQSIQHTEALLAQRMDNYFGI